MPRPRFALLFVFAAALCIGGACQAATPISTQTGPSASQGGSQSPAAPVDQERSMAIGGSTTNILLPSAGQPGGGDVTIEMTFHVGNKSDGNVEAKGKQAGGAQTDEKKNEQRNDMKQELPDPAALLDAATKFADTVDPTSAAGKLAKKAIDAVNDKKLSDAAKLLEEAKKADTTPGAP
jgi:hypothetical protein